MIRYTWTDGIMDLFASPPTKVIIMSICDIEDFMSYIELLSEEFSNAYNKSKAVFGAMVESICQRPFFLTLIVLMHRDKSLREEERLN